MKVTIPMQGKIVSTSGNEAATIRRMETALIQKVKLTPAEMRIFMYGGDPTVDTSKIDKKIQNFLYNPEIDGHEKLWKALGFRVKDVMDALEYKEAGNI